MGNYNRDNRSSRGGYGGGRDRSRGPREMFDAVCADCGNDCQIPFRPSNGRPVYCSNCFGGKESNDSYSRNSRDDSGPRRPSFPKRESSGSRPQNNPQLDTVIQKLDKILEALTVLQVPEATAKELIEVAVEKAPAKKKKAAVKKKKAAAKK